MIDFLKVKKEITSLYQTYNITEKSELDWLFCSILKTDIAGLFDKKQITKKEYKKLKKVAKKRVSGMPLSKILKEAYFYKECFYVNTNVLTPRKETELLVEEIIKDYKDKKVNILDIGTGSGCIAILLKKHLNANVTALDISKKALKVAKKNAKNLKETITFIKSNLFEKVNETFDVIVSNPPYIKSEEINSLQEEVKNYDPHLALDGGITGYNIYKQIIKCAPQKLKENGKLYLELGIGQSATVKKMLEKKFKDIKIIKDYNNIDRIIVASNNKEI